MPETRRTFRACDRRYPFLWATCDQPPGRWHGAGEGPCHYLATTAEGAWSEVVRHEEITEIADLFDLELALWEVDVPVPRAREFPALSLEVLTGPISSYPQCQAEARRLRSGGASGLVAPSASVRSGEVDVCGVNEGGQLVTGHVETEVTVVFGTPEGLAGQLAAVGHPDPGILDDVRHL